MPAAGKPSLNLYQRLGEDVVNELVDWVGQVDTAYRTELHERNEALARRFELRLTQVTEQLEAKLERRQSEVASDLKSQIAGVQAELIKWTFLFWLGTIGIVVLLLGRN
jgi:hypothetical protein